jgi:hypothetical protein
LGVFLPYVEVPGLGRFVNLLWGTVYGLCLFLTDSIAANRVRPLLVFSALIWPVMVTAILFWSSGVLWRRVNEHGRVIAAVCVLLSVLISVSVKQIATPPFDLIPTYWKLMFVVW